MEEKESGFGSGVVVGLLVAFILVIIFVGFISPLFDTHIERVNNAKEECRERGLPYSNYDCNMIDVSNTTLPKYEESCYALCGYPI